jgi:hypothetical protein
MLIQNLVLPRVFRKVRKTPHQYQTPKPGEIFKNLQKSTLALRGSQTQKCTTFCGKLSFIQF